MTHRSWKQPIRGIAAASLTLTIALGVGVAASTPAGAASSKAVTTANVPGVGIILVDAQGHALYTHTDAKGKAVACTGACATLWPPLTVAAGAKVNPPKGVKTLATTKSTHQVTMGGLPLYRFSGDTEAMEAKGNGVNGFGGTWHAAAAKAQKGKSKSKSAPTTNAGTGGVSF